MKSLKEKWLSKVQSAGEKGEKGIGGFSTVTPESRRKRIWGAKWRRRGSHCGRGKRGFSSDIKGWGKISSRREQRMGGRIIQVERVDQGKGVRLWMRRSPLRLLAMNALRATPEEAVRIVAGRRRQQFVRRQGPASGGCDTSRGVRGSHAIA